MFYILQYVREMQDENNVTIVNEKYEQGHTESEFYIVSSDAEVRHGIKALWTDLNFMPRIIRMK